MKHLKLKSVEVHNYRTIRDCKIDLSEGVAGIIGVNGSGKTNIWRGVDFMFKLIRERMSNVHHAQKQGMRLDLEQKDMRWEPLGDDPRSILPSPQEGQTTLLRLEAEVSPLLIPFDQGQRIKNLNRTENHTLELACKLTAHVQATGEIKLVPEFSISIHNGALQFGDIQALAGLWHLFTTARISAQRPPNEFLQTMLKLLNQNVDGHIAVDRLNDNVLSLNQNFAKISFVGATPTAIEGEIPDLTLDNMSSGNLRAYHLLSAGSSPELGTTILIHAEEPETNFHPTLQRHVLRSIVASVKRLGISLFVETHSPEVLAELFNLGSPVYRLEVVERQKDTRLRRSDALPLPRDAKALEFLRSMGIQAGFATLGGVILVTDGTTDEPAYREFFNKYAELRDVLISFIPMGCLESHGLELLGLSQLASRVVVIADGHFLQQHGERLEAQCREHGIEYVGPFLRS